MTEAWWAELVASVKRHEGLRLKPYRDSVGLLTIGYGRNLDQVGITADEAERMLEGDLRRAYYEAARLPGWDGLTPARQAVMVEMAYNLGYPRLLRFSQALGAVEAGDYDEAARQMLASRWAAQVGLRATTLAEQMRKG
jgi:lysozyme